MLLSVCLFVSEKESARPRFRIGTYIPTALAETKRHGGVFVLCRWFFPHRVFLFVWHCVRALDLEPVALSIMAGDSTSYYLSARMHRDTLTYSLRTQLLSTVAAAAATMCTTLICASLFLNFVCFFLSILIIIELKFIMPRSFFSCRATAHTDQSQMCTGVQRKQSKVMKH